MCETVEMKLIVGVDMSSTHLGWAILSENKLVVDTGVITFKHTDFKQRCTAMAMQFMDTVGDTLMDKDIVVIEEPEIMGMEGRNSGSNNMLFFAVGTLSGMLTLKGYEHELITVRKWKGNAPKQVIWNRLVEYYGEKCPRRSGSKPWDTDSVDALGIADWYARRINEFV
jgi:Holliday junction resolvasome RuvABC endonuclease subunit